MKCIATGCEREQHCKAMCHMHYMRWKRNGNMYVAKWQLAKKNKYGDFVSNGWLTGDGYKKIRVNGKIILEHRYFMEKKIGRKLYKYENIHHIDGNKSNNDLSNLEIWISKQPKGQRLDDLARWARVILKRFLEVGYIMY